MAELPNPCYLIDGQGMELHLRRQHPTRSSSPWSRLSEWSPAPGDEGAEVQLFGPVIALPKLEPEAPPLACTGLAPAEIFSWIRRDARRRTAACRYILVSADTELRRLAREQGLVVLDPETFLRRMGLMKGPTRRAATDAAGGARTATEREPRVIKGGKTMSEAELAWWTTRMELAAPEEPDEFSGGDAPSARPAPPDEELDADPERAHMARMLGARTGDPRLVRHEDEEWLARQFPDGEGERPRPQPGGREKQRRR